MYADARVQSQCQPCRELHRQCLSHISWESLVQLHADQDEEIVEAMSYIKQGKKDHAFKQQSVCNQHMYEIEMKRAYRVLTAAELRKELAVPRLTQKMVKGLVSIELPSDQCTKIEQCYVFKSDQQPGREMVIKQRMGQKLKESTLSSAQHKWQQQAERVWQAGASGMLDVSIQELQGTGGGGW